MGNFYLLLVAFAALCYGQPTWEFSRAHHSLIRLPAEKSKQLCALTNMTRLHSHLDSMLIKRVSGSPGALKVYNYIRRTLSNLGFHVDTDYFTDRTPYGQKKFRNIIATWNPQAARRLVLACHYDSKYFTQFEFLAATDSAYPCSAMIHVAEDVQPFLWNSKIPDITLQLLFFDGEEAFKDWTDTDSLYGSRHLAEKWEKEEYQSAGGVRNTLSRIDVLVLLDLLGAANPQIYSFNMGAVKYFDGLVKIEKRLKKNECSYPMKQVFQSLPKFPGSRVEDDHIPFMNRNVSILHVIPVPFPRVWHTEGDSKNVLHDETMYNLLGIFRQFVVEYLQITDFDRPMSKLTGNNDVTDGEAVPAPSSAASTGSM